MLDDFRQPHSARKYKDSFSIPINDKTVLIFTDTVILEQQPRTTGYNGGPDGRHMACRTPSPAAAAAGGGARCWRHHPASLPARCHGHPRRLNEGGEEQKEEADRPRRHEIRMMPSCCCIGPIVCNAWFEQIPTRKSTAGDAKSATARAGQTKRCTGWQWFYGAVSPSCCVAEVPVSVLWSQARVFFGKGRGIGGGIRRVFVVCVLGFSCVSDFTAKFACFHDFSPKFPKFANLKDSRLDLAGRSN